MDIRQVDNIRAEVARSRLKATDLAEVLDLNPRVIRNRLNGISKWQIHEIERLAYHLDLTVDDLLGRPAVVA